MSLTKIGSIGINTGIAFAGVTTIVTLNTANDALSIGATVNVGSGITLGASGDIFATGVSTFSGNLKVGSGVTISPDGDVFFTGIATGNGSGLTALNASNLGSGTVPTARLGSGTASSSTFLRGDSSFQTVNTDLVSDTSPQLGGNLDVNTKNIVFGDSAGTTDDRLTFGAGTDLSIYHDGSNSYISNSTNNLIIKDTTGNDALGVYIQSSLISFQDETTNEQIAKFVGDGAVELYHNNSKTLETTSTGVSITNPSGIAKVQITGFEGNGAQLDLIADEGDDNGDSWVLQSHATSNNLNFRNDTSGSSVVKWNLTTDGDVTQTGHLDFPDSKQIRLGAGDDLLIYHNGSDSLITDSGTGSLALGGSAVFIQNAAHNANMASFVAGAEANLFHNGIKKLQTNSTYGTILSNTTDDANYTNALLLTRRGYEVSGYGVALQPKGGSIASQNGLRIAISDGGGSTYNSRFSFTNDGLLFNSDTATANALDDYEEGTWTPLIRNSNGTGTAGGSNYGYYSKIGNIVHAHATVHWTALSGGTTSALVVIVGLPFTSKNSTNYRSTTLIGGQVVGVHNTGNDGMNIAIGCDANMSSVYVTAVDGSSTSGYNYTHYPTVLSTGTIFGFSFTYLAQ